MSNEREPKIPGLKVIIMGPGGFGIIKSPQESFRPRSLLEIPRLVKERWPWPFRKLKPKRQG